MFSLKMLPFRGGGATHLQRKTRQAVLYDLQIGQNEVQVDAFKLIAGVLDTIEYPKDHEQGIHSAERAYPGGFLLLSTETRPWKIEVLHLGWNALLGAKEVAERLEARIVQMYGGKGWFQAVGLVAVLRRATGNGVEDCGLA